MLVRDFAFVVLLAAAGTSAACSDQTASNCGDACDRGQVCSNGLCVTPQLPLVDRPVGGRNVDTAMVGNGFAAVSVDPAARQIVVTEVDDRTESRVLHTFSDLTVTRAAISASENAIVVVWREGTSFVFATRPIAASRGFWEQETVAGDFTATDDFDVAIDGEDRAHIVFRDGAGTFRVAEQSEDEWGISTIDSGRRDSGLGCEESDRFEPNMGNDPRLEFLAVPVVVYHDGVCGDLRLARRIGGAWNVEVVDDGEDGIDSAQSRVGRFPSVVQDVNGDLQITYFDETQGRLKLASELDGQFVVSVVDGGAEVDEFARSRKTVVGAFSDVAIRADGEQRIAYYDATNQSLRIASRRQGQSWDIVVSDDVQIAGMSAKVDVVDGAFVAVYERVTPEASGFRSELVWKEIAP